MDEIVTIVKIDWRIVIVALTALLIFVVTVWKNIDYIKQKLGIRTRRDDERDLLMQTAESLSRLQEQHANDMASFRKSQAENMEKATQHDEMIKEELRAFTREVRESIDITRSKVDQYEEHRNHDRAQSFGIQKELTDSIKSIAEGGDRRDAQIKAITAGSRELLGNALDQKFDKYISLKGIPADELDEFVSLHDAYKGCGGNHRRDSKFNYVMEHLEVLPVKSNVINDEEE